MGFSTQDAEDLTSETCESIVRHIRGLRNPHTFEAWFWRIARNKFHDHLRRRRRTPQNQDTDIAHDGPEEKLVIEAEHESVRVALQELPARDRELLWLRDVAGLPYGDIAGRYGATSGAVRVAVMRARRRLEEALAVVEAG
jgi:RNA polymerase sigma-70 factor (ECF subfamily)